MAKKSDNTGHSFLAYFKRATSPLVVLRLLLDKPMYGYELTQEMKRRSGGNFTIYLKSNQYLTVSRRHNKGPWRSDSRVPFRSRSLFCQDLFNFLQFPNDSAAHYTN